MPTLKRISINITGRVQGVFFRHTARLRAEEFGLCGWARNEDNGSVTVAAEGEEGALRKFIEWCRHGPPLARVDNIQIEWQEAKGEFKKFEIQ